MGQQIPNISLLPRLDLTSHLPFLRPAPPPIPLVTDEEIAGLDANVFRSVASILQRTDMTFL